MSDINLLLMKFKRGDTFYILFIFILLSLFFIVTIYPIIFVISASFTEPKVIASGKLLLLPIEPTLEGYKRILLYDDIWSGYANTIYYTVLGTLLNLAATLPCAYALSRRDLKPNMVLFVIRSVAADTGRFECSPWPVNKRTVMLINGWSPRTTL